MSDFLASWFLICCHPFAYNKITIIYELTDNQYFFCKYIVFSNNYQIKKSDGGCRQISI